MSYTWITPKTDWTTTTRFEYTDYNRIRNNLLYINEKLNELYPDKAQTLDLGDAKTGYANEYAVSEFNAFEEALESFTRIGQDVNIGDRNYYRGNNSFIWADALNRLEQCCVRWKEISIIPATGLSLSVNRIDGVENSYVLVDVNITPSNATHRLNWTFSTDREDICALTKWRNNVLRVNLKKAIQWDFDGTEVLPNTSSLSCDISNYTGNVTVSVDNLSATIAVQLLPLASYETSSNNENIKKALSFRVIKKKADGFNNVHLIFNSINLLLKGRVDNADDRQAQYRTAIEEYVNAHFSSNIKEDFGGLLKFWKVVHSSNAEITSYGAKYHILSNNEIGNYPTYRGQTVATTLGNDDYPYIISGSIIPNFAYDMLSRSRINIDGYRESLIENIDIGSTINWEEGAEIPNNSVDHNICPIIALDDDTVHLVFIGTDSNNVKHYRIDWTGQASTVLYDAPLGSIIHDI